MEIILVI